MIINPEIWDEIVNELERIKRKNGTDRTIDMGNEFGQAINKLFYDNSPDHLEQRLLEMATMAIIALQNVKKRNEA